MKPPRPITPALFVLLVTACGNHNNVQIGPNKSDNTVNTSSPNSNNTAPNVKSSECDPNYSGCVPIASDVDCAGKGGNGPAYVQGPIRVTGKDIYGLDRDGNGIACE
ncbi:MAG TPA: hypothetical protein VHH35_17580 [Pyrinomonadaceae bacterium]|nr:hypothetical protein [Pyrinomonadaceae bacterium]